MMIEIQIWHMITLLLSFFGAVWAFWKYINAATEQRIVNIEKEVDRIKNSPVLNRLESDFKELRACQRAMQDAVNVMRTSLTRIEDFLLNKGAPK